MLTQLFYTSLSHSARGHASDFAILSEAMENNRRAGLTGYLLRDRLRFCQILEGAGETVEATFARIARDPRHSGVTLLLRRPVEERAFAGWSMGYADLPLDEAAWLDSRLGKSRAGVVLRFDRLARLAARGAHPLD